MLDATRVSRRHAFHVIRRPVYLDSAAQIAAVIEAGGALDADPGARTAGRRALIATLIFAGLRIGEATALRRADVDLANGRISVRDAKTAAGERLVDILPALRDELASYGREAGEAAPDALVFATSSGSRRDKDNARERVIRPVVAAAEELLGARTTISAGLVDESVVACDHNRPAT